MERAAWDGKIVLISDSNATRTDGGKRTKTWTGRSCCGTTVLEVRFFSPIAGRLQDDGSPHLKNAHP
jgi:hypothetical protein